jgi:hypothetical protein
VIAPESKPKQSRPPADGPAAPIGRPPKNRPELADVAAAMRDVRRLRDRADALRLEAAELEYRALKQVWSTYSLADAATAGVTTGRVQQIVKSR